MASPKENNQNVAINSTETTIARSPRESLRLVDDSREKIFCMENPERTGRRKGAAVAAPFGKIFRYLSRGKKSGEMRVFRGNKL